MDAHASALKARSYGQRLQLVFFERGTNRNLPGVDGDVVPAEQPTSIGEKIVGQRPAIEVDGQHRTARQRAKAAQQIDNLIIREVMQKQRAEYEIETGGPEGQMESVGGHSGTGGRQVIGFVVERSDLRQRVTPSNGSAHIARGGAYIEH